MIFVNFFNILLETLLKYNFALSRFILAIIFLFIWYGLVYLNYNNKKTFTINDYRIESRILTIFILSTFFITYLLGFLYLRIINIQKTINIYEIISKIFCFYKEASWFSIFSTIFLILTSLLIILFFINSYRKLILKYYLQLHFLIISYYPTYNHPPTSAFFYWHFDDEQPYESLKYLTDRWVVFCRALISNSIRFLPETKLRFSVQNWLYASYKSYGLMIMIYFIFYDIFLNNGKIKAVFYIMPFVFLYYLLCKYEEILHLYTFDEEECIATYLYFDIVLKDECFTIFSNEKMISTEELSNIIENVIPSKHK